MAVRENGVPISETRNMESSSLGRSFDNRAEGPFVMSSGVQSGETVQSTGSWRATALAASSSPVREKRKRIDRSHLMTIEDLLDANKTENKRKMSLGHGLQAIFEEDGLIRFQFRLTQNGQDTTLTLGNSGEMTLAAARQEALRLDNEVRIQKRKGCDAGIVAKVKRRNQKNDSGRYPTLRSIDDAICFMELLFGTGVINPEVKCAIALQVLIPARLGDLLRSKWRDFQPPQNPMSVYSTRPIDHFYSWYIPSPENSNNRSYKHPQRIVHLSSRAIEVVEWRRKTSHVNDDPVFPELSSMPRLDCNRLMSETVKDIWPSYYLEPGGFRNTLHILLSGLDLYQPKFIDDIVNNRYRLHERSDGFYLRQVKFILDFFGSCFPHI